MNSSADDLPPPYVPPAPAVMPSLNRQDSAVPQRIIIYAMVGKPLLWVLHRVANGLETYSARGTDGFIGLMGAFAIWSMGSLVVVAIVYAGGAHAWAQPTRRPRLLRFGFGCCIALNILLTGLVILLIGVSLSAADSNENQSNGVGDLGAVIAALFWLAGVVVEWLAWRRLGRVGI